MSAELVRMIVPDMHPDVAASYKVYDVIDDGPVLLTAHGRPIMLVEDFDDGLDGEDTCRVIMVRIRRGVTCVNSASNVEAIPEEFTLVTPAVNPSPDLVLVDGKA